MTLNLDFSNTSISRHTISEINKITEENRDRIRKERREEAKQEELKEKQIKAQEQENLRKSMLGLDNLLGTKNSNLTDTDNIVDGLLPNNADGTAASTIKNIINIVISNLLSTFGIKDGMNAMITSLIGSMVDNLLPTLGFTDEAKPVDDKAVDDKAVDAKAVDDKAVDDKVA